MKFDTNGNKEKNLLMQIVWLMGICFGCGASISIIGHRTAIVTGYQITHSKNTCIKASQFHFELGLVTAVLNEFILRQKSVFVIISTPLNKQPGSRGGISISRYGTVQSIITFPHLPFKEYETSRIYYSEFFSPKTINDNKQSLFLP